VQARVTAGSWYPPSINTNDFRYTTLYIQVCLSPWDDWFNTEVYRKVSVLSSYDNSALLGVLFLYHMIDLTSILVVSKWR